MGDHDLRVAGADGRGRPAADARRGARRCCARWELHCTRDRRGDRHRRAARASAGGEVVGEIPARLLTDECPRYEVEQASRARVPPAPVEPLSDAAPKTWIYEQYDQLVGSRTVRRPGLDAAVLRLRPSLRGLAVALEGPPPGERDPCAAGVQAVLGAARNVACAGGEPIGLTDCLNFGNPEKPEIAYELARGDRGHRARPQRRSGSRSSRATSRSTTRPTAARSRRRRSSAASGSCRDVRPCRADGSPATSSARAGARGRTSRPRRLSSVPLEGGAAPLARHDVGYGGLEHALAEAARLERPRGRRRAARRAAGRRGDPRVALPGRRRLGSRGIRRDRTGALDVRRLRHPLPDRDVARLTYFGLFALQHRGQESAGIAVSDQGRLTALRDLGLVTQVFDEQKLHGLHGNVAIGHTRYSTTGSSQWSNAQPLVQHGRARTVALGHNGNLVNETVLRDKLAANGVTLARDLRQRGDRCADRERRGAARPGGRERDGAGSRARIDRRAVGGDAGRVPRPARFPPARARPHPRRLGRRVRDLRARSRRRRVRARGRARRAGR